MEILIAQYNNGKKNCTCRVLIYGEVVISNYQKKQAFTKFGTWKDTQTWNDLVISIYTLIVVQYDDLSAIFLDYAFAYRSITCFSNFWWFCKI